MALPNGNLVKVGSSPLGGEQTMEAAGAIVTSVGDPGVDTNFATEKAVRDALNEQPFSNSKTINSESDFATTVISTVTYNVLDDDTEYLFNDNLTLTRGFAPTSDYTGTVSIRSSSTMLHTFTSVPEMFYSHSGNTFNRLFFDRVRLTGTSSCVFSPSSGSPTDIGAINFDNGIFKALDMGTLSTTLILKNSNFEQQTSPFELVVSGLDFIYLNALSIVGDLGSTPFGGSHVKVNGTTSGGISIHVINGIPAGGDTLFDFTGINTPVGLSDITHFTILGSGGVYASGAPDQTNPFISASNVRGDNNPNSHVSAEATQTTTTTAIDIPATNAYVISTVAGWSSPNEERITVASDGSFIFTGLSDTSIDIDRDMKLDQTPSTQEIGIREWHIVAAQYDSTFTNATNIINRVAHGLSDGDNLTFRNTTGTLPAELRDDIIYYVVSANADDFQVSYTSGGAAVAFTDDGTPTNNYQIAEIHGSEPSQSVAAGTPQVLSLKSKVTMATDCESVITVINKGAANDIQVYTGGYLRI